MGRKFSETTCKVDIIKLSLNNKQIKQCSHLLKIAGQCYSDMISAHVESRKDKWLSKGELQFEFKGKYDIHSQSIQAIAEKIESNIESARSNREKELKENNKIKTEYPYKSKKLFSITWKKLGIKIKNNKIHLSNGKITEPLILDLPCKFINKNINIAELVLDSNVFYLHIVVDTGIIPSDVLRQIKTIGIDMGEIHIAYCTVEDGKTIGISGRQLRSVKQLRNKRHKSLEELLSRCKSGSKRYKKLTDLKNKASSKLKRQQRDILHKASRQVINFCQENKVANIAIGDVRNISDNVNLGKKVNQKISQWTHGQFSKYVKEKGKMFGMTTKIINESYSSKTCSNCGHVNNVINRNYCCSNCKYKIHRDANGSANICSKSRYGQYSKIKVNSIKYLRPTKVGRSRTLEVGHVANATC